MPFTVRDFHSLVRGLERNPEWKAELRRLLLSEDLLSLPDVLRQIADLVRQLAEAQQRTEEALWRLTREVGDLKGSDLERRYRERAAAFFQGVVRRIRLIDHQDLGQLLDDAVDSGRISPEEKAEIMQVDVVLSGRRDDTQVYAVVASHPPSRLVQSTRGKVLPPPLRPRLVARAQGYRWGTLPSTYATTPISPDEPGFSGLPASLGVEV